MGPNCGGEPTGPIRKKIEEKFGSFSAFKQDFSNLLAGHFGSGWGWLVLKEDGSTDIVQTHDAGSPLKEKLGRPLLCCDVWEHAYYIDYKNDRASYINIASRRLLVLRCEHSWPYAVDSSLVCLNPAGRRNATLAGKQRAVAADDGTISQCVNAGTGLGAPMGRSCQREEPISWPWSLGETAAPTSSNKDEQPPQPEQKAESQKRPPRLSKRVMKMVRSIERLYRPPATIGMEASALTKVDELPPGTLHTLQVIDESKKEVTSDPPSVDPGEYEGIKGLVKSIYRSATGRVFNDALWKRYVHRLSVVAGTMQPADICLVMYSFAKVRYRDQQLLKILNPLIVRHISGLSCSGAALILNSMKRLELSNYDIIDLATNEICLKMDTANMQDIALTANALSFFQVYHQRFWNMLFKAVSLRHHQMTPLQASLILAALAKLDIRHPMLLRLLKDKLRPAVERNELTQELLTLTLHSFAKLDFSAKNLYEASILKYQSMLEENPETVDAQSLVLYLYTAVCMLDMPLHQTVEKSLKLLCTHKDVLKNYKAIKLKYVVDHLKTKQPALLEACCSDVKSLIAKVEQYKLRNVRRRLSRWCMEVSRMLAAQNVNHTRNVWFDYIHADLYIKELGVVIKCAGENKGHVDTTFAGPFSYYAMSNQQTVFAQVEINTLSMKDFKVCVIPYHEWNALKTEKAKQDYLKRLSESWNTMEPLTQPT
ncbi:RAP domain-containing protein [Babesia ovata]|uniref:RAP domain-containing protein n=1 Tax=Babesia ovata TaxID=189622 RepID=A0A2H6KB14_9APIC|nr:RAP domain-containing protein [Babesia ovata]GBE60175.1 RAP domain-containing protein [Babesia ovata]